MNTRRAAHIAPATGTTLAAFASRGLLRSGSTSNGGPTRLGRSVARPSRRLETPARLAIGDPESCLLLRTKTRGQHHVLARRSLPERLLLWLDPDALTPPVTSGDAVTSTSPTVSPVDHGPSRRSPDRAGPLTIGGISMPTDGGPRGPIGPRGTERDREGPKGTEADRYGPKTTDGCRAGPKPTEGCRT